MKENWFKISLVAIVIVALMFLISFYNIYAAKTHAELSDRCVIASETWLKQQQYFVQPSYQSHYNRKLSRCFMFVSTPTTLASDIIWDPYNNEPVLEKDHFNGNTTYGKYSSSNKLQYIDADEYAKLFVQYMQD